MIAFLLPEEQHQHKNGGGWVANTATVDDSAFVGADARVSGDAWVSGDARVYGDAWVYGNAWVSGNAWKEAPLYIQGSRHAITNCAFGSLSIGCITLTFSEWKKQYKAIGKEQNYSAAQIKEYGALIALAVKIGK